MMFGWVLTLVLALALPLAQARAQQPGETFKDCPDCPTLVVVPTGTFQMGAEGGEPGRPLGPIRTVTITRPFALATTEVTVGEWRRFVAETGNPDAPECRVYLAEGFVNSPDFSWHEPGYRRPVADDEPVTCVSWRDAKAYTAWLAERTGKPYRLPSEAEYEWAALAGASTDYFWGAERSEACRYANVYDTTADAKWGFRWGPVDCDDGYAEVSPVGSFAANPFGLYDMIGNVWEWLEDCYVAPYPAAPLDATPVQVDGACANRAVRGGSWITAIERQRPVWRGRDPEEVAYSFFGLRVARDLAATD